MEDAFASFVTTGKLNFGDLAKSVISDIARIQARAAISGLFSAAASAVGSYFGGGTSTTTGVNSYGFHLAGGGSVTEPGSSTSDSIPAMLSNGEYVLNAAAVARLGIGNLDALNSGATVHSAARFATGGYVGAAAASTSASRDAALQVNVPVTIEGSASSASNLQNSSELGKKITSAVRAVIATETKQGGVLWKMRNGVAG
jgi:lambda family phage tail tape measure protein